MRDGVCIRSALLSPAGRQKFDVLGTTFVCFKVQPEQPQVRAEAGNGSLNSSASQPKRVWKNGSRRNRITITEIE